MPNPITAGLTPYFLDMSGPALAAIKPPNPNNTPKGIARWMIPSFEHSFNILCSSGVSLKGYTENTAI